MRVLVDLDNNSATGCTVATPSGPMTGVEQLVTATINTAGMPPTVTGVVRQVCAGGVLGAAVPISAGGWSVGVGLGVGGADVIEMSLPVPPGTTLVRLGFVLDGGVLGQDALIVNAFGGPILLAAVALDPQAIPTLSSAMLALLVVLVGGVAWLRLRRSGIPVAPLAVAVFATIVTMAWAAIVLDGLPGDWAGTAPLANDPSGDAPAGADIAAAFGRFEGATLFVRVDAKLVSPVAITSGNAATFTVGTAGTFAVTASGVPTPAIALTGALPSGVLFTDNGNGSATLAGTPAPATGGIYAFTFTAGSAMQGFTLTVTDIDALAFEAAHVPPAAAAVDVPLAPQPWVRLVDSASRPILQAGVTITASVGPVPPGVGVFSFSPSSTVTAVTDAAGIARFTNLALRGPPGPARLTFQVTAGTPRVVPPRTSDLTLAAGTATTMSAASAATLTGAGGTMPVYPAVVFTDVSGNPAPAPATAAFTVIGGACAVTGPSPVNGAGVAQLAAASLTIPATAATTASSCRLRATSTPALPGSPIDFAVVVTASSGNTWLGGTSSDYGTAANWSTGVVPSAPDAIAIPAFVFNAPSTSANQNVAALRMEAGSTLQVGAANTLTVAGPIDAATVTGGTVVGTGAASTVRGSFASLAFGPPVSCAYTLNGPATATGNVQVSCPLTVGGQVLTIGGNLGTAGTGGRLVMTNAADRVTVTGSATFAGATENGFLTNGLLEVGGPFSQANTVSANSFTATGSHTTRLFGAGSRSVFFISTAGSSQFNNLDVVDATLTNASIINVAGNLTANATAHLGGMARVNILGSVFPSLLNPAPASAPVLTSTEGSYVLTTDPVIQGALQMIGGSLNLNGHVLTVAGDLRMSVPLTMNTGPAERVSVGGNLRIDAAGSDLQTGTMEVAGNFFQTGSTTAYTPLAAFLTRLNGTGAQSVEFVAAGTSFFGDLEITNTSGAGVTFIRDVTVLDLMDQRGRLAFLDATIGLTVGQVRFWSGSSTTFNAGTLTFTTCEFGPGAVFNPAAPGGCVANPGL